VLLALGTGTHAHLRRRSLGRGNIFDYVALGGVLNRAVHRDRGFTFGTC